MSNFSSYMGYKTKNSPQKWFLTVLNHLPVNKLPLNFPAQKWQKLRLYYWFLARRFKLIFEIKMTLFWLNFKHCAGMMIGDDFWQWLSSSLKMSNIKIGLPKVLSPTFPVVYSATDRHQLQQPFSKSHQTTARYISIKPPWFHSG